MHLQLWTLGRAASVEQLKKEEPSFEYISAGDVPLPITPPTGGERRRGTASAPADRSRDCRGTCGYMRRQRAQPLSVRALTVSRSAPRMGTSWISFWKRRRITARMNMEVRQRTIRASCSMWSQPYLRSSGRSASALIAPTLTVEDYDKH
jgi:hypothetical protein